MSRYELKVPVGKGELIINFESLDDFKSKADEFNQIVETANKMLNIASVKHREPKPSFEDIYRFTQDGFVELLKIPKQNIDTIILVMFAYSPDTVDSETIAKCSGVQDAAKNYMTNKKYEKYFTAVSRGVYSLKQPALDEVVNRVIPELRQPIEPKKTE